MIGISAAHRQMAKVLEKGCSRPVKRGRSHFSCFGLLVGTIWFKLNDGKIFPRQSPRRFFKSYRGFLHMFSMSLYELNGGGEAFFCA